MRIQIDELAQFIFVENTKNKLVGIQIDGISSTSDMFSFCVDLLYKGLHLLYGNEKVLEDGSRKFTVRIDEITMDQFDKIKDRLRLAGIEVNLTIKEVGARKNCIYTEIEMQHTEAPLLEHHHMIVAMEKAVYDIFFKLIHNVKPI
jgi:hypothetical protein